MRKTPPALLGLCLSLATLAVASTSTPDTSRPVDVGSRLQLFLDRALVESLDNARLVLHPPIPREVVFTFDAPWEGPESGYVTVLTENDGYRLYYRGGGETTEEVTCLATSPEGVHWTRPTLGLFDFQGSRQNNIVYRGRRKSYGESHNFTPFKDPNPAATPAARYKALGLGRHVRSDGEDVKALIGLQSPDGVRWTRLGEEALITDGSFDSQNVAFWDTERREYVCYLRDGRLAPDGRRVRSVKRCTSPDFVHWSAPVWLDFGDLPLEHFYVNTIAPYLREPRLYLGFPMRFVPERTQVGAPARRVDGLSDAVLISSRDGLHFDRTFPEAFLRPGPDPLNWGNAHGNNTPAWGLAVSSPTEVSLYWAEHYGSVPRLRRGTVRLDGFASVNGPQAGGVLVTRPLRFQGHSLRINYATSAVGSVRVEVLDGLGAAWPGFSLDDCEELYGDEVSRAVTWKSRPNLGRLAGATVRLRFSLKDADLYALQFGD